MNILKTIALAVGLAITGVAAQAAVWVEGNRLYVDGTTSQGQMYNVAKNLNDNPDIKWVVMSGPGGDYYAGIMIGRILKQKDVRVLIPTGKQCVSACAMAAMGGKEVWVSGELWFHRPFLRAVDAMRPLDLTIGRSMVAGADLVIYLTEMGFNTVFPRQVLTASGPCKFLVVNSRKRLEGVKLGHHHYQTLDMCGQ